MMLVYIDAYRDHQQLHRHNNPTLFALLGWLGNLDGKNLTELRIVSPTAQLNISMSGVDFHLLFSGDNVPENRSVTVSRSVATEMALYFLKNDGLPPESRTSAE